MMSDVASHLGVKWSGGGVKIPLPHFFHSTPTPSTTQLSLKQGASSLLYALTVVFWGDMRVASSLKLIALAFAISYMY